MKEEYWANYKASSVYPIHEHEQWIREPANAKTLGIPLCLMNFALGKFRTGDDRDAFLRFLMKGAPIMRVRGHGVMVTFEYHAKAEQKPMSMIHKLGAQWFGPYTLVNIFNFATDVSTQVHWADLCACDELTPTQESVEQ